MQTQFGDSLIEKRSIDYVPIAERHGKVWHLWPVWFSGDAHLATVATGVVGVALGGNLVWMAVAVILGSALGTHPYPLMVRDFQKVIGEEARAQILAAEGRLPNAIFACVGGGSNAIGIFHRFLEDADVRLIGVEAGGTGTALGQHAARFSGGAPGVLQGAYSYLLQDEEGQVSLTHSVSAGLDYALVGPEHAWLHDQGRAEYTSASDAEALAAAQLLSRTEGLIPALESSHAVAEAVRRAPQANGEIFLVNLSGRGDKDIDIYRQNFPDLE